ncbi:MAG: SDR family oxidoreductase [Chloroflexi bacterium]|nr:SDR family oxidoreductase [Chloroflexota bacterium]
MREAARAAWEPVGTYHHFAVPDAVALDLADSAAIDAVLKDLRPDGIVHTAAMARPDECAAEPQAAEVVNVEATAVLARSGVPMVYLSSDLVYGNLQGPLTEDRTPEPLGVYAQTKLGGEQRALEHGCCVARTALVYGWSVGPGRCAAEEWVQRLRDGRPVRAFTDQSRCVTYAGDLAAVLPRMLDQGLTGVYNVAGPELISRYDFGVLLAREFGAREDLVEPSSLQGFGFTDPRPSILDLPVQKLQAALTYDPLGPVQGLREMHLTEIHRS